MILYSVLNSVEETIKTVAFKFQTQEDFNTALTRTIEASVRSFVASKKQAEILGLRTDIVTEVKSNLDAILADPRIKLSIMPIHDK